MRSTVGDVATLARRGYVYGVLKRGRLASVRLRVSIYAAYRCLEACNRGSSAKPGSITTVRQKGLKFTRQINIRHAKLGKVGGPRKAIHLPDADSRHKPNHTI
jgi:DNA-binding winged helix-turn-helix (wHTH) protein